MWKRCDTELIHAFGSRSLNHGKHLNAKSTSKKMLTFTAL